MRTQPRLVPRFVVIRQFVTGRAWHQQPIEQMFTREPFGFTSGAVRAQHRAATVTVVTLDRLHDASWRVRLSDSRPGLAYLSLVDHRLAVTRDALLAAVATARSIGATRVRTSALADTWGPLLSEAGFVDFDRLVLLQRRLDLGLDRAGTDTSRASTSSSQRSGRTVRLRRLGRRHLGAAALIDRAAFGSADAIGREGLVDVLTATPSFLGRAASFTPERRWTTPQPMVGFVLCGASGSDAYIQRLAVDPAAQRQQVASTLMSAALDWMSARGTSNVLVNTQPDNVAALALYERWGFQRLSQQLIIAERSL